MYRSIPVSAQRSRNALAAFLGVLAAVLIAGCAEDDTPTAPTDPPVEITELFPADDPNTPEVDSGTLTRNGAATFTFIVQRAGDVTARIDALEPADAVVGLSLGPASSQACTAAIARDNATLATQITGTASTTGAFCVRIYDASGSLSGPVTYRISVRHF